MNEGRLLPDWIDAYMDYTKNSEPADSFRKWVAISVIGACLQRKCMLQWEGTMYPNLYVVLVGPSGSRKGTAMRPGREILESMMGINLSPEAVTREQLIRRLRKAGDTTISEGATIIGHASLTVFSEELTVFLGYNNNQLMADLCDWYDCKNRWRYETKNQGVDDIMNVWVSLIGATTPRLLETTMPQDAIGGGLTSRIIFIYQESRGRVIPTPFMTAHEVELEARLVHDLEAIKMLHGEFIPTDSFLKSWIDWYTVQHEDPPFADPRLEGYLTRRGTHVLKLSMVMNASRCGDMKLTKEDFDRALYELSLVEKNMPYVFRGIGKSDMVDVTNRVMATIARYGEITFSALLGKHYYDVDRDGLYRIVGTLTALDVDGKGGRFCMWKDNDPTKKIIVHLGGKQR